MNFVLKDHSGYGIENALQGTEEEVERSDKVYYRLPVKYGRSDSYVYLCSFLNLTKMTEEG